MLSVYRLVYNYKQMGRYIEQNQKRSELQQQIADRLRKQSGTSLDDGDEPREIKGKTVDGVDDMAYLEGTKATTTLAPAWVLIAIVSVAVFVYFVYQVSR